MSTKKIVFITSSDGVSFEVDEAVAFMSQTIADMLKDHDDNNAIKLFNVTGKILAKVIEYCKKHVDAVDGDDLSFSSKEELKNWDAEFLKIDLLTLFEVMEATHFLNIESLSDLTYQTVADMITGKTPDEIANTFSCKSCFTPEEDVIIRQENTWAFE